MTLYPSLIIDALRTVRYPGTGKDIVTMNMVADDIRIDGNRVSFSLVFDKKTDPFIKSVVRAAEVAINTHISDEIDIRGNINVKYPEDQAAKVADRPLPGVKNIIGVSSGKGGVGKSTIACNLAVALAMQGYRVGLLDADIFGPSIPKMFGVEDEQLYMHEVDGKNLIIPAEKYGVKLLSIGFVVDKDYFVIDMPPGTSDIHLTLVQTLGITGAIVVTTPQEVALADARKGVSMFLGEHVNVPVLGIVENMSWFTPASHPDEQYFIFGRDGGKHLAEKLGVELLGQIPLVAGICKGGDDGVPVTMQNNVSGVSFQRLATRVVAAIDQRNQSLPPTERVITHS